MHVEQLLGELLTLRFLASVVLDLDVEVQAALTAVQALAALVGALEAPGDLDARPSLMLLPPLLLTVNIMHLLNKALVRGVIVSHRQHFVRRLRGGRNRL